MQEDLSAGFNTFKRCNKYEQPNNDEANSKLPIYLEIRSLKNREYDKNMFKLYEVEEISSR